METPEFKDLEDRLRNMRILSNSLVVSREKTICFDTCISCVKILSTGQIAVAFTTGTIQILDSETNVAIKEISSEFNAVICFGLLSDGRLIFGTIDGAIQVWDYETHPKTLVNHYSRIISIVVLDGDEMISVSSDRVVKYFDGNQEARTLWTNDDHISCMIKLPDRNVAIGTMRGIIQIVSIDDGSSFSLERHTREVTSMAVTSDGRLVSGSADGCVILWGRDSHEKEVRVGIGGVFSLCMLPDDRLLCSAADGTVHIWSIHGYDCEMAQPMRDYITTDFQCFPDNRVLFNVSPSSIEIWK